MTGYKNISIVAAICLLAATTPAAGAEYGLDNTASPRGLSARASEPAESVEIVAPSIPDKTLENRDLNHSIENEYSVEIVAPSVSDKTLENRDLNLSTENEYVEQIRDWLKSLQPLPQARARQILREAHPGLHDLRKAIYDKKAELASLSYDSKTEPEALPRLGQELQLLRRALRAELEKINQRLHTEAGVNMGPLGGEGFWLQPLPSNKTGSNLPRKRNSVPLSLYLRQLE